MNEEENRTDATNATNGTGRRRGESNEEWTRRMEERFEARMTALRASRWKTNWGLRMEQRARRRRPPVTVVG